MICDWYRFPGAAVISVENVREHLCDQCVDLVDRYRIANVRL